MSIHNIKMDKSKRLFSWGLHSGDGKADSKQIVNQILNISGNEKCTRGF